ncbi:MAG: threonine synthase [Candidatus Kuenenbacteria bacterium]
MIKYKSTRGENSLYNFSEAILKGIANDGGLFVPAIIPKFTLKQIKSLINKSFQERALFVFDLFKTGFSNKILRQIIKKAYFNNFDHPKIAPLIKLKNNQYILELWHGPTLAFKDMALQIIPLLFSEALKVNNNQKQIKKNLKLPKYLILTATSGDTGKAALEGYKNLKNIFIIIFYPKKGISKIQELQMITQEGNNVGVYGVYGNFDDVQEAVKKVFNDKKFNKEILEKKNIILSSANSINWGRLLPQIIYHISGYLDLLEKKIIKLGDEIDVAVPSGNFGNILAAFYAKKMGLPINRLICASNENNILSEFFNTGIYDVRKKILIKTPSPSMDIIVASNIERLLFEITQNSKKVSLWMKQLRVKKKFKVDKITKKILSQLFFADWASNKECLKTIKKTFNETGYLMDPHTAVAQTVVEKYCHKDKTSKNIPIIICSTAHWAKFAKDVYKALLGDQFNDSKFKTEFEILEKISNTFNLSIPKNIKELETKIIRHKEKCRPNLENIKNVIRTYLK